MAGLTVVRSWHTRDFLFVILAFLFVNVCMGQLMDPNNEQYSELNEAAFGFRSYPPMMLNYNLPPPPPLPNMGINELNEAAFGFRSYLPMMPNHNLPPPPTLPEMGINELNEAIFGFRSYPPMMPNHNLPPSPPHPEMGLNDPFNRMPSNAHELTPDVQPLNNNLELVSSPQYRSNPGEIMPFYEEFLSDNLQPEYRSHHVEALPFYEGVLNDNLQLGRLPEYRSNLVGDLTVSGPLVSTFSHNMHPLDDPQEANYRSHYHYLWRPHRCYQPLNVGSYCLAQIPRWYYNVRTNRCELFLYTGCYGNRNNFKYKHHCNQICRVHTLLDNPELPDYPGYEANNAMNDVGNAV